MNKLQKVTLGFGIGVAIATGGIASLPTLGQSIIPAADGTGTNVGSQGNLVNITGGSFSRDGANLFHSFQQLNVPVGTTANFVTSPNIQNILSRVVGGNPSIINGLIQVTGSSSNLFLINPAGIIFGNNASLNIPAAFTATTANQVGFGNNNWLTSLGTNNYQNLTGTPNQFVFNTTLAGSIVNAGNLTLNPGQNLTLLGGAVLNTGTLASPGGNITIAAVPGTNLVRLSQPGHLLSLEFVPPENGIITPLSLPQLLTGNSNIMGIILNPDGTLPLAGYDTPLDRGNTIISGRINTVNRNINLLLIPRVQVLGDRIALLNTVINASSVYGGGTVLIGGEYLGQGTIPTAQFTFADLNTRIRANGLGNANGGRVIAWGNNTTRFFGSINARGGNLGGNGGFIETSGKLSLDVSGIRINASSAFGSPGLWFLDPTQVDVIAGSVFTGGNFSGGLFTPDGLTNPATIGAGYITSLLNAGTSVTIETNPSLAGGSGDINVNSPINSIIPVGGITLSLLAARDININASIIANNAPIIANTQPLNVNLNTLTGNININGQINTRGGNFTANANNSFIATDSISTATSAGNSGNINIRAINGSIATQILNSSNNLINGLAGSVTLQAPLGISVGTINSSRTGALLGTGNFIDITTDGLFRANNSLTAPPTCVGASLCSYGNAGSGNITLRHGGGVTNPFVVVGATSNGTLGGIYSSGLLSGVTVPVPPAVNSYFAGSTTIITSVPPPILPSSPPVVASPEFLRLLRNPEAPPTPPPVVVGTPPTIEPVPESSPTPTPILSSSSAPSTLPDPLPALLSTSLPIPSPTPPLEASPLPLPASSPLLTREQVDRFARDLQRGQSLRSGQENISPVAVDPLPEIQRSLRAISINPEVNSALIYIFFSQPDTSDSVVVRTHAQGWAAVERSSLLPSPDDQLEIMVVFETGDPIQKTLGLTRREVLSLADNFRREITAYQTNPRAYLTPSQNLYSWFITPIARDLQERRVNNLNFILDRDLRSLPLAALHDGQGFLVENYSLAIIPSGNLGGVRYLSGGLTPGNPGRLWAVSEEVTLGLMTNFSDQLTITPFKAEALRRTQLAMLRRQVRLEAGNLVVAEGRSIPLNRDLRELGDRDFSHPYFWSAFILGGNP